MTDTRGIPMGYAEAAADMAVAPNEVMRLREALRELLGALEIAAVMPEAIGKHLVISMDDPMLERARAALTQEST